MSFDQLTLRRHKERHPLLAVRDEPDYMVGAVSAWIWMTMIPAKRYYRYATSYGLKHSVEGRDQVDVYCPNDLFKGCMLLAGFKVRNLDELNWEFKVKPRHGRRVQDSSGTGIAIDRERSDPTELALFDSIASWARLNAHFDSRRRRARAGYEDPPSALVREEDRQAFRTARRRGLVGPPRISREVYDAIVGDCPPRRPRRVCA